MRQYRHYTLVEIMVVMALAALLAAMALPAFGALMHGNSVAVTCGYVKNALDQAQARAVTDRKYVATVMDLTGAVSGLPSTQAVRNCYVTSGYAFEKWVDGSDWIKLDQDAQMLVFSLGESGAAPSFPTNGQTPSTDALQPVSGVRGAATANLPGVVFSMYGSVKAPGGNFYIGVGEATLANNVYIYKNTTSGGAAGNVMALTVNHFTGRSQIAGIGSDGKIE